jgi:iron(III) transport system substrate-binding protein
MRLLLWFTLAAIGVAATIIWFEWVNSPSNIYNRLVREAEAEGVVEIYSVTDRARVEAVIDAFERRYPAIRVNYQDLSAEELYSRAVKESRAGGGTADLLWSSAMDLQVKFANDGFAQAYASPEKPHLPDWAIWQDEAYGTTAEPVVFAFNKRLTAGLELPLTHGELRQFLVENRDLLNGKVGTYDPVRSAAGYLYLSQDAQAYRDIWGLVRAMATNDVKLFEKTSGILAALSQGKLGVSYNIVGSYALEAQQASPDIAVVLPRDYTLVMSRIAVIPKAARHPNAGKLFLDFLLSAEAQTILAEQFMAPVRTDVPVLPQFASIPSSARAIRVGPGLLVTHDQLSRASLLETWQSAIEER